MCTYVLLPNLILAVIFYGNATCQLIFHDDPDDSQNVTKCGKSTLVSTIHPLITNGTVSQMGNFPWHAGLYFREEKGEEVSWEQKCGGSLITDRFVLTAAHCVSKTNERDVRVALGKIYRSWDHYEYGQQRRNVSNIIYPYDFQEVTYYFDVALLRLDEEIRFGKYVMPVCRGLLDGSKYVHNKTLFVTGWGQTKNVQSGSASEILLYNDMSYLPKNHCKKIVPPGFEMFDKFCAIKNNNTEPSVVQRGDSGGGLTAVHDGLHYIFGIVSIKLTTSYDSQMTLFTNITWPNHIFWIEREVKKYHSGFKWSVMEVTTVNEVSPTMITTTKLGMEVTTEKEVNLYPTVITETELTTDVTTEKEVSPTMITATELSTDVTTVKEVDLSPTIITQTVLTTDVTTVKEVSPTMITATELTTDVTTVKEVRTRIINTEESTADITKTKQRTSDMTTLSSSCVLPDFLPGRRFCSVLNGCIQSCSFDNYRCLVPPGTAMEKVMVLCVPDYFTQNLSSTGFAICQGNEWYPPIPSCYQMCQPRQSKTLVMTCHLGKNLVNCSDWALPNTTVSFKCAPTFTEDPYLRQKGAYSKFHTCGPYGIWSDYLPDCKPACGVFNKDVNITTPTSDGGQETHPGFLPWYAGIYYRMVKNGKTEWEHYCSGSVISKILILTAARCVEQVHDYNDLRVAVGKYYRSWDIKEQSEQKLTVLHFTYPYLYSWGKTMYDMALLVLREKIVFGDNVLPVCRDDLFYAGYTSQDSDLYVARWGRTEQGGNTSDVLLYNIEKLLTKEQCENQVPSRNLTDLAVCAINDNNTESNNSSIIQAGVIGGGLTAVYSDGLHYLIGVASTSYDRVSLFTNVKVFTHVAWLRDEMQRF